MRTIELKDGLFAMVDDEDYPTMSKLSWGIVRNRGSIYCINKGWLMHRLIMKTPIDMFCDHIDGNGLNNQKSNLRNCSHQQNMWNRRKNKNSTSQYKGVSRYKNGKWLVHIKNPKTNKVEHIGLFEKEVNAALAYNQVATKYFGEFAHLNIIHNI